MNAPVQGSCSVGDRPGGICRCTDFGLLLIRLMLATVFIYHGGGKLFGWFDGPGIAKFAEFLSPDISTSPYPLVSAYLSGGTEFFGGIILIVGCGARLAAIPMAFNMAIAILTVHLHNGFSADEKRHGVSADAGGGALGAGLHGSRPTQALRLIPRRMLLLLPQEREEPTGEPSGEAKS